jgi:hypothetical protein
VGAILKGIREMAGERIVEGQLAGNFFDISNGRVVIKDRQTSIGKSSRLGRTRIGEPDARERGLNVAKSQQTRILPKYPTRPCDEGAVF